ncbi:MAG: hypothetical protein Q7T56_09170 [Nocardioidaceae bacterium]|nr:hypothetical protein [Nocardioidaceae bacterium]
MRGVTVTTGVDLYWLPLGAGGHVVAWNGRVFEALVARRETVERADRERSLDGRPECTDALGALVSDLEVVLPFRLGHPTAPLLSSPRRPAETVTVSVTPSRTGPPYDPASA